VAVRVVCRGAWLARETRAGVLHAKHAAHWGENLCTGPWRTSNAARGLLLSTIGRRQQGDDRHGLVGIKIDEQDVKKARVDRQKSASP